MAQQLTLPALIAYNVGMAKIQYTVRGVPERLDSVARKRARKERKSLNATLLEALHRGLGMSEQQTRYSDLDDLAGSWVDDPEFDRAMKEMDRVDPELWK